MELSPIVCWLAVGIVLAGLDMFLGTIYLLMVGLACGCGALAAWAGATAGWQFSIFACAMFAGSLVVWVAGLRRPAKAKDMLEPDVGQIVMVEQWRDDKTAMVRYRGALWTAQAVEGAVLAPGPWKIVRVPGARLLIEPAEQNVSVSARG